MKRHEFRRWVQVKWQQYCYEHDSYNEPHQSLEYYWQQYRWWLKDLYRKEQAADRARKAYEEKYNQLTRTNI